MGMFDSISSALTGLAGQVESAALPTLLNAALAKTDLKDMQGLLDKLQQSGLGKQVSSWLGDGKNLPITVDQLKTALGNQQIQQLAALACTRFRRHRVRCFNGTGGGSWSGENLRGTSSLRLCG